MLLEINSGLIIWTVITFLFLLGTLKILAWKPLLRILDEREGLIRDALEKAEVARQEAQKAVEDNQKAITQARFEAQEAVSQGREAAQRVAQEVRNRAEAEAQQLLDQARRAIQQEKDQAIHMLQNKVAELAILAAGKILDENMDDDRNRKIVDDFINHIPDSSSN